MCGGVSNQPKTMLQSGMHARGPLGAGAAADDDAVEMLSFFLWVSNVGGGSMRIRICPVR